MSDDDDDTTEASAFRTESSAFNTSLRAFHNSATFSDATLHCEDGGREFPVHRVVLASHSKYFRKMLDGEWKESQAGVIPLKDVNERPVEAMVFYFYNFDYGSNKYSDISDLVFHAQVYSLADRYLIPDLQELAKKKFRRALPTKSFAKNETDRDNFLKAIIEIYTTTPETNRGLRDLVLDVAQQEMEVLLNRDSSRVKELLGEATGFAADMFLAGASKKQRKPVEADDTPRKYQCPDCEAINWFSSLDIFNDEYRSCGHCRKSNLEKDWVWSCAVHDYNSEW